MPLLVPPCSPTSTSTRHFSLGQGVSSPEVLIDAAVARGFDALACTDTNAVYGAVEFQRAALERGVRPILGAHLVPAGRRRSRSRPTRGVGRALPRDHGDSLGSGRAGEHATVVQRYGRAGTEVRPTPFRCASRRGS